MNKSFFLNEIVRTNVLGLKPYSSARDEYKTTAETVVFLDANENPFATHVNRYPDPQQWALKQKLASVKQVGPDQLLLGNGSDEVLDLLFRAFCEPLVDNVITLPPTYGMYAVLANINAVENREVMLTSEFNLDVDAILNAQNDKTKLVFVCSPNNPTGNMFSRDSIERLLDMSNAIVVIDEAYIDFAESDSWLASLRMYPNLVVIQTLSKAYGMAGIRLGICYASTEIIAILNKIKPPYNVTELTQQYALDALQNTSKYKNDILLILREKECLIKSLLQLNFVKKIVPSQTNFILIEVDDATKRYQQLLEKGIVVRNRGNLPLCKNTLRCTIGTPEENQKLITALKQIAA